MADTYGRNPRPMRATRVVRSTTLSTNPIKCAFKRRGSCVLRSGREALELRSEDSPRKESGKATRRKVVNGDWPESGNSLDDCSRRLRPPMAMGWSRSTSWGSLGLLGGTVNPNVGARSRNSSSHRVSDFGLFVRGTGLASARGFLSLCLRFVFSFVSAPVVMRVVDPRWLGDSVGS
jgi:hypothetical protein